MTQEELLTLMVNGQLKELVNKLGQLNETERKSLSTTASRYRRVLAQHGSDAYRAAFKKEFADLSELKINVPRSPTEDNRTASNLSIYACCPISHARKVFIGHVRGDHYAKFLQVLTDRRPDWIDQLIAEKLALTNDEFQFPDVWKFVDDLVRAGICKKPDSDDYVAALVAHLFQYWRTDEEFMAAREQLVASPDFLTCDVYRIFEIESNAFCYQWHSSADHSWNTFLLELLADNKIDRQKIIECSIRSLSNRFKNNVMSGFGKFLESLEPTTDELTTQIDELGGLLASPTSQVVTLTLKQFKILQKSEAVEPEKLLEVLPHVFQCQTKSQPKTALTLIQQATKKRPDLIPVAINSTLPAISHPDADVQEKAIKLLSGWADRAHSDHAVTIEKQLDDLSPTVVAAAKALVRKISGESPCESNEVVPVDVPNLDDLQSEIDSLPERWRNECRLSELMSSFAEPVYPPPLEFRILDVPVLTGVEPIQPILDREELIDAIAHAIETVDSGEEAERLLDGMARLAIPADCTDFQERTRPVVARLRKQQQREGGRGFAAAQDVPPTMSPLLQTALGDTAPAAVSDRHFDSAWCRHSNIFIERILALRRQLDKQQKLGLLSAPTHERGWVDPLVFVDRINEWHDRKADFEQIDFLMALLRLAPDNRKQARQNLRALDEPLNAVLLIALDGEVENLRVDFDKVLVNVAGHVRAKDLTPDECRHLGVHPKLANGKSPVIMSWKMGTETHTNQYTKEEYTYDKFNAEANLLPPFNTDPTLKEVFWVLEGKNWQVGTGWRFRMNDWNSKLSNEHYLMRAAKRLFRRIDDSASSAEPNSDLLEALFEPDRIWSETAHLVVLMGLCGKDNDSRGVAIDALIEAVETGRANPIVMGQVIDRLFECWSRRDRLAKSLADVARLTPLHRWFVKISLEPMIAGFVKMPRDAAKVLELYVECLIELELAPSQPVTEVLASVKGSSKSAKLAKRAIKMETSTQNDQRNEAKIIATKSRIERAKRWDGANGVRQSNFIRPQVNING